MAFDILDIHEQDQNASENIKFYLHLAKYTSLILAALSSLILAAYLYFFNDDIMLFMALYGFFSSIVYIWILSVLVKAFIREKNSRFLLFKPIGFYLLYMPLLIAYCFIINYCNYNLAKVEIINDMDNTVTNVQYEYALLEKINIVAQKMPANTSAIIYLFKQEKDGFPLLSYNDINGRQIYAGGLVIFGKANVFSLSELLNMQSEFSEE